MQEETDPWKNWSGGCYMVESKSEAAARQKFIDMSKTSESENIETTSTAAPRKPIFALKMMSNDIKLDEWVDWRGGAYIPACVDNVEDDEERTRIKKLRADRNQTKQVDAVIPMIGKKNGYDYGSTTFFKVKEY